MDRDLRAAAVAVEAAAGEKGWNTKDLAGAADVDPATVADFLAARRWPRNVTRAAIERALGWPGGSIALIAGGAAAPAASSSAHDDVGSELLAEAARLNRRQQGAVLTVVRAMLDPQGKGEPAESAPEGAVGRRVTELRPPRPDLSDPFRVAARRGESEGRRLRGEQDDDTENP